MGTATAERAPTTDTSTETNASSDASTSTRGSDATHTVVVHTDGARHEMDVEDGKSLRTALWEHDLSPHDAVTEYVNCGGRGHCATCAVEIIEGAPEADQWLDAALEATGVGRASCEVEVDRDMTVRL